MTKRLDTGCLNIDMVVDALGITLDVSDDSGGSFCEECGEEWNNAMAILNLTEAQNLQKALTEAIEELKKLSTPSSSPI